MAFISQKISNDPLGKRKKKFKNLDCSNVYKYYKELKSTNINTIIQNEKDISGSPGGLRLLSILLLIPAWVMILESWG